MEGLGNIIRVVAWWTMMVGLTRGALHNVGGGKYNWVPNTNFTEWSNARHFYVGDWLYFGYDKNTYNVLEVNKNSYENCIDTQFIKNVTKGGRDVYELTEAKSYYFISGGGFCFQGMKLSVNVTQHNPPSPSPSPDKEGSSAADLRGRMPLLAIFIWTFLVLYYQQSCVIV